MQEFSGFFKPERFKVNNYDTYYLDLNNRITLCKSCHAKYHEKYGLNCNIKNLLEFKKDAVYPSYVKLKKNYDTTRNMEKQLREENKSLKKKHSAVCKQNIHLEDKNRKLKRNNKKLRKKLGMTGDANG